MTKTSNLGLEYIAPAQAQKHVSVNEAFRLLDIVVQPATLSKTLSVPPASPMQGDKYVVGTAATGDWAGQDNNIAAWVDGLWLFVPPKAGWQTYIIDDAKPYVFDGASWIESQQGKYQENDDARLNILGVGGATADSTNRLTVNSPAVLFNNVGNGIQLKVNKKASSDTASFLFQSAWNGHAEIGLAGDNDFHFKVSSNGSSWKDALVLKSNGSSAHTSGHLSLGTPAPTNFWSGSSQSLFFPQGYVGHNGSHELGIWWNGYRNNSGSWTSMGAGGSSAGAGISLGNGGIRFYWSSSVTSIVPTNMYYMTDSAFYSTSSARSLGTASKRWSQVYAASGTISTSDARTKTIAKGGKTKQAAEKRAAAQIRTLITRFKYNDAVAKKGTRKARIHFGVMAQDVEQALIDEGLNPEHYGFLCKDQIEQEDGQPDIYGIRYDELVMFLLHGAM